MKWHLIKDSKFCLVKKNPKDKNFIDINNAKEKVNDTIKFFWYRYGNPNGFWRIWQIYVASWYSITDVENYETKDQNKYIFVYRVRQINIPAFALASLYF